MFAAAEKKKEANKEVETKKQVRELWVWSCADQAAVSTGSSVLGLVVVFLGSVPLSVQYHATPASVGGSV